MVKFSWATLMVCLIEAHADYTGTEDTTYEEQQQGDGGQQQEYGGDYQSAPAYQSPIPQTYVAQPTCGGSCNYNAPCWDPNTGSCGPTICATKAATEEYSASNYEPTAGYGNTQEYGAAQQDDGEQQTEGYRKLQYQGGGDAQSTPQSYGGEQTYGQAAPPTTYAYANEHYYYCNSCSCPANTLRCVEGCVTVSTGGRAVYWTVFGIMLVATGWLIVTGIQGQGDDAVVYRILPFLAATVCLVSATQYLFLVLGSGLWQSCPDDRPLNVARYLDWVITTPLILIMLAEVGGISIERRYWLFALDVAMVFSGFCGALSSGGLKWLLWALGLIALGLILNTLYNAPAWKYSSIGHKDYRNAVYFTAFVWILYAVVWVLSDATSLLCANIEALFYGLLDLASKVALSAYLISTTANLYKKNVGNPGSLVPSGSSIL